MLEQVDPVSLHDSPLLSPARSDLAGAVTRINLARLRVLAWVLVIAMPILMAVDAWVLLSFGPDALPGDWRTELALRILWMGSGAAFLVIGRASSASEVVKPHHHLAVSLFVPAWLALAGIHAGIGASSGSNISVYLLAVFVAAAFLYLDGRRIVLVYGLAWLVLVASLVHLHSSEGTRIGPDLVNGSLMTVLAAIVSRLLYTTRARENYNERLIARQKADLERMNLELAASNEVLQRISMLDHLTGIPNRRYFDETLSREWKRAAREGTCLGVIMIDIDYFKGFNDGYGHRNGDACLIRIATAIQDALKRPGDMLARYGGDEFAVLLPDTDPGGAQHVAERIHGAVADQGIDHFGSAEGRVSISLGIACWQPDPNGTSDLMISAADDALYRAKREGRNLIVSDNRR